MKTLWSKIIGAKKDKRIAAGGIIILMLIAFVSQGAQQPTPQTVFRGSAQNIDLQAEIDGSTLELSWTPLEDIPLYEIYHAPDTSEFDQNSGQLIDTLPSSALSLTPFVDGFYKIYGETRQNTLESNTVEVQR